MQGLLEELGLTPFPFATGAAGGLLHALSSKSHTIREGIGLPFCRAIAAAHLQHGTYTCCDSFNVPLPEDPLTAYAAVGVLRRFYRVA